MHGRSSFRKVIYLHLTTRCEFFTICDEDTGEFSRLEQDEC